MTTPHSQSTTIRPSNGNANTPARVSVSPADPPLATTSGRHHVWPWIVALAVLAGGGWAAYRVWHGTATAQAAGGGTASRPGGARGIPVLAAKAAVADVPIYLDGVGSAQALNTVMLRTRVDGQLVKLSFTEGQDVHEGDPLAVIDPRPYEEQKAQAEGQLAQARGQSAQAEGQLAQAQGQVVKDQATLDNAQRDLDRYTKAADAVPRQQIDTAKTQVDQAKAAIAIDNAAIKGAQASIQVADAAMQVANVAIQNAELMLKYTQITAPISGRIGLRYVDMGNMVHATDANGLALITQVQPITVVFTLQQDALPQVQKALREQTQVKVLAFGTSDSTFQNPLASGTVLAVDNQIDMASATFRTKAVFENKDGALFPNQLVNVELLVETRKNVVVVPSQAVQRSPQSTFVDVIKDDLTVEQRTVTPGPTQGGRTIIAQGLKEGETVATGGLDRLDNGTKVALPQGDAPTAEAEPPSKGRGAGSQPSAARGAAAARPAEGG